MADENTQKGAGSPSTLAADVEALESTLSQTMKAREDSLSLGMKIRAVALVVVLIYFAFLYSLVASFDADQAVTMVRGQMDVGLPQMKQDTIVKMKAAAPQVVASYTQNVVDSIPAMRQRLEDELLANTGAGITHLQAGLNETFGALLKESKTELDKMGPGKSTDEKLQILAKGMRIKFHEESRSVVDGLAKEFRSTLMDIEGKIKHIQTTKNPTPEELHEREMLRVWSKLMQMKMKDVNKKVQEETHNLTR